MIGSTLDGKYHITKLLGAGAMGQVYEAQHDAMIGLSLPKATPGSAVPYGLVQGIQ